MDSESKRYTDGVVDRKTSLVDDGLRGDRWSIWNDNISGRTYRASCMDRVSTIDHIYAVVAIAYIVGQVLNLAFRGARIHWGEGAGVGSEDTEPTAAPGRLSIVKGRWHADWRNPIRHCDVVDDYCARGWMAYNFSGNT